MSLSHWPWFAEASAQKRNKKPAWKNPRPGWMHGCNPRRVGCSGCTPAEPYLPNRKTNLHGIFEEDQNQACQRTKLKKPGGRFWPTKRDLFRPKVVPFDPTGDTQGPGRFSYILGPNTVEQ